MSRIYVALDLETTGLNPERDAILEIGLVKFRGQEILETWSSLVNPGRPIPYRIQQLTGITPDEVRGAPPFQALARRVLNFVRNHPIVGHSIDQDLAFLNRWGLFLGNLAIDTFELAGILLPHAARYSLGKLSEALGIDFPVRHRALEDALATQRLFLALLREAEKLPLNVIREINRLARDSEWPLRYVFQDVERALARSAFTGSIGQQLAAKGALDGEGFGLLFEGKEKWTPLRPAPQKRPLDEEALAALLDENGPFARHFPGYEHRPQQIEMLRAVTRAFNGDYHLLVEAGTGTGKSLAYLIPAVFFALQNGEPVVVSTNTINLQDQLFNKDIPDLQRILSLAEGKSRSGPPFRAALLKGRSNYICLRKLVNFRRERLFSNDELRVLAKVLVWLPSTLTGDQAELFLPNPQERLVWNKLASDPETCLGERCPYFQRDRCFFYRARRRAERAHIIVVNHALLLSDVAVENRVLPSYRYLVIDEAHHLEESTTRQLSFAMDRRQVEGLLSELEPASEARGQGGFLKALAARLSSSLPAAMARNLSQRLDELRKDVRKARGRLDESFKQLTLFLEDQGVLKGGFPGDYARKILLTMGWRAQPGWASVEIAWDNFSLSLARVLEKLERLATDMMDLVEYDVPDLEALVMEVRGHIHRLSELKGGADAVILQPSPDGIYWLEVAPHSKEISLHAAPLHVGELVRKHLFEPKKCVVLTSATLRTEGNFDHIRERLSAWEADELAVGSPFDYARAALVYIPTDIPEPNTPYHQKAVEKALTEICLALGGRTMALFTSYSQLRATAKAIIPPLAEEGIVVYEQGDGSSRHQLLEGFRTTPKAVLLGTRSFWEGVDVMGEALSCLVIVRLPFSVPDDPIFMARSQAYEDPFNQYALPEAILRFRQGFGRLIRSKTDRGVAVILDKRVLTKPYGRAFLESLPPCTIRQGPVQNLPTEAIRWLEG